MKEELKERDGWKGRNDGARQWTGDLFGAGRGGGAHPRSRVPHGVDVGPGLDKVKEGVAVLLRLLPPSLPPSPSTASAREPADCTVP